MDLPNTELVVWPELSGYDPEWTLVAWPELSDAPTRTYARDPWPNHLRLRPSASTPCKPLIYGPKDHDRLSAPRTSLYSYEQHTLPAADPCSRSAHAHAHVPQHMPYPYERQYIIPIEVNIIIQSLKAFRRSPLYTCTDSLKRQKTNFSTLRRECVTVRTEVPGRNAARTSAQ